ncbi:MAPEG family protein [Herbaspirillum sp. RTI4]|uniref:MAPEG family protein n=1 Tax=Herbaspirillum sp. RTI4 TaxID=3048640 RepID=UPI002AB4553A|nr:MAPEG family protein [Herbaspirillum sp. RTI4]MDY7579800.1 MAPEG family protein [Herbaspirillum sp. RTI4]MEA9982595.1 MAPEG family protein [Herbaspirillum sp. RTI4]
MSLANWCILIAGLMPVLTIAFAKQGAPDMDNAAPRDWLEKQTGLRRRADYAHRNHFEAFPFFAAAVLIAQQTGVAQHWTDSLAILFICARLFYTGFYLSNRPSPRSIAWVVGYLSVICLFVASGLA